MPRIMLDVPVPDVAAAVDFYRRAFGATPGASDGSGAVRLDLSKVSLRVVHEAGHVPDAADAKHYEKGRTPRLELRTDDVQQLLDEAIAAGAMLRSRNPRAESGKPPRYAHILDPFGHLWALAQEP
jgi:uncharacterized glyoxalase superfamily protein PhnB